jgi:branched-chain amino acid transport system ATP-binding protein
VVPLHHRIEKNEMITVKNQHPGLEVRGVTIHFGGVVALSEVSLDMHPGEIHALIGPNGSGKSTLINVICGIYRPLAGRILLEGCDITSTHVHQRAQKGIARTFQNIRVARTMTVLENLLVGMHPMLPEGFCRNVFRTPKVGTAESRAIAQGMNLLARAGLEGREHVLAGQLSHAELKRLELARAIACSPRILLLDEPTAGLGDQERGDLMEIMKEIVMAGAVGILLVEHSMRTVMAVSHRISVLDHGAIIAEGSPREIQNNEKVIEAYLGRRVHSNASR